MIRRGRKDERDWLTVLNSERCALLQDSFPLSSVGENWRGGTNLRMVNSEAARAIVVIFREILFSYLIYSTLCILKEVVLRVRTVYYDNDTGVRCSSLPFVISYVEFTTSHEMEKLNNSHELIHANSYRLSC